MKTETITTDSFSTARFITTIASLFIVIFFTFHIISKKKKLHRYKSFMPEKFI